MVWIDVFDQSGRYVVFPGSDYTFYKNQCDGSGWTMVFNGANWAYPDGQKIQDGITCSPEVPYQTYYYFGTVTIPGQPEPVYTDTIRVPDEGLGYIPTKVMATLDQQLQGGGSISYVGYLRNNLFNYFPAPFSLAVESGSTPTLMADQAVAHSSSEKYQSWSGISNVTNYKVFSAITRPTTFLSSFVPISSDTVQCRVAGTAPGGWLYFSDPWTVDQLAQYGSQNRGNHALFYAHNSPYVPNITSPDSGLFLNVGGTPPNMVPPYYCVGAPLVQTLNGYLAFFSGWATNGAQVQDGGVRPGGYDSAAIVFNSANGSVTALYSYSTVAFTSTIPSGTWTTDGGLTVNAGVTLTVSSGATLKFPSGGLTVNGTLVANGATFTSTNPPYTWGGITINASGSSLTGCTISYAAIGITFTNGITGTMNECTVQNCNYGILVQGGSSPTISSNTCTYNTDHGIEVLNNGTGVPTIFANSSSHNYSGIYVYNSTPLLQENSCTYNSYAGVWCNYYASPTSGALGQQGNNSITNNIYGILAMNSSYPDFGGSIPSKGEYWGVCNNIESNSTYNAAAASSSGITAEWDFWGAIPPPKIYWASGCYVDDSYAETDPSDCPLGGGAAPIAASNGASTSGTSTASPFSPAIEAQMTGNYSLAISDYNKVLADTTLEAYHPEALARLYSVFQISRDSSAPGTFLRLKSSNSDLKQQAEELLASSEAALGRLDDAVNLAQDLKSTYPDSQSQIRALLVLVSLRGFNPSYSGVSKAAFTELVQKYAAAVDLRLLGALRTGSDVALPTATTPSSDTSVAVDSTGSSLANYPNPFNPSTQIRYTVRQIGFVSLKVYDILGREVATLVNEVKTPGTYNVNWNANQLATGIYFARFEAAGKVAIKKLLYLK